MPPQQPEVPNSATNSNFQPTPPSPLPSMQPVPVATDMSHPQHASVVTSYDSNPFIATAKGLGAALVNSPGAVFAVSLIPFLALFVSFVLNIVTTILDVPPLINVVVTIAMVVGIFLVCLRSYAGAIVTILKSQKGESVSSKNAMGSEASGRLLPLVGTMILTILLGLGGMILFIIPGIIILARAALAPFIVYEERLSGFAAIKRSFQLTKGHTFEMIGVSFAQAITFGNGMLSFVGSLSGVGMRYRQLKDAEAANASTGKMHFLNWLLPTICVLLVALYIGFILFAVSQLSKDLESTNIDYTPRTNTSQSSDFSSELDDLEYCYYAASDFSEQKCVPNKSACLKLVDCKSFWGL